MRVGNRSLKNERLNLVKCNKDGDLMKIIEYNNNNNIIVEFQDAWKETVKTKWISFNNGGLVNPHRIHIRLGATQINTQGDIMKCIEYVNSHNITVEFQDEYKYRVKSTWDNFQNGKIKNMYHPSVYGVGVMGSKYPRTLNKKCTKEYRTWMCMLDRCYNPKHPQRYTTYKDVTVCDEWLFFEKFYEWLHSQENFKQWIKIDRSALDKDILIKHNKIYSPDTCCLVSDNINGLFEKDQSNRGDLPIGVCYDNKNKAYIASCREGDVTLHPNTTFLGYYSNPTDAFYAYKQYKEQLIKNIANEEYKLGNITKRCYEAMVQYEVEITD